MKRNEGWAIHLHHDMLVEWCEDYKERKKYIIENKGKNEIKTRLRLFKLLPKKAVSEIPIAYRAACKAWLEADKAWLDADKAYQEAYEAWLDAGSAYQEAGNAYHRAADKAWRDAGKAWLEADKAWRETYEEWRDADKAKFHEKWCGCKAWNGEKLIFRPLLII